MEGRGAWLVCWFFLEEFAFGLCKGIRRPTASSLTPFLWMFLFQIPFCYANIFVWQCYLLQVLARIIICEKNPGCAPFLLRFPSLPLPQALIPLCKDLPDLLHHLETAPGLAQLRRSDHTQTLVTSTQFHLECNRGKALQLVGSDRLKPQVEQPSGNPGDWFCLSTVRSPGHCPSVLSELGIWRDSSCWGRGQEVMEYSPGELERAFKDRNGGWLPLRSPQEQVPMS